MKLRGNAVDMLAMYLAATHDGARGITWSQSRFVGWNFYDEGRKTFWREMSERILPELVDDDA